MKRLLLLVLLLFCAASLHAQDYCDSLTLPEGEQCKDVDPFAQLDATFCEWIVESNGSRTPIANDLVYFESFALSYSGYHTHGYSPISDQLRPGLIMQPSSGRTSGAGCLTTHIYVPGISGTYRLIANSTAGGAFQGAFKGMTVGAHYTPPPTYATLTRLIKLPQTPYMVPQANLYDAFHLGPVCPSGGCNFWIRELESGQFQRVAKTFFSISGGTQLEIFRASLPEGGLADDDIGANLNGIPGGWYASVRSAFEWHAIGDEVDVISPSFLANDTLLYVKNKQLTQAAAQSNCGYGQTKPDASAPADPAFWETQKNMHLVCGRAILPIIPPSVPN